MFRLLFWDKELHGRPDLPSTVSANATAESLGEVVLPLAIWLGLCLNGEQPGSSLLWKWSGNYSCCPQGVLCGVYNVT